MEFFGIWFWIAFFCGIGLLIYKKVAESRKAKPSKFAPLIEQTLFPSVEDQDENPEDDPDESWIEAKKRVFLLSILFNALRILFRTSWTKQFKAPQQQW